MRTPLAALFLVVAIPAIAAEPVPLHCARGATDYPDAAMELSERGADARPQPLEPELSYKAVSRKVVNR